MKPSKTVYGGAEREGLRMKRGEDIIDYRGRLRKPINKVSRRQKGKLAWRKKRKAELWKIHRDAGTWPVCPLCDRHIFDPAKSELCHDRCVGMRGDGDEDANTFLGHTSCNRKQGSRTVAQYRGESA